MEIIKTALEKAQAERQRLQQKSLGRRVEQMVDLDKFETETARAKLLDRKPFKQCSPEQQETLLADGKVIHVTEGETFQFAGEIDGYVTYLLKGTVFVESDSEPMHELSVDENAEIIALDKAGLKTRTITAKSNSDIFRIAKSSLPNFNADPENGPLPQVLYTETQSGQDLAHLVDKLSSEEEQISRESEPPSKSVSIGENTLGFNLDFSVDSDREYDINALRQEVSDISAPMAEPEHFTFNAESEDEIGEFTRDLERQFRAYIEKIKLEERQRYEQLIERHAAKLKQAAERKLREKVQIIRGRYDEAFNRKEQKLLQRLQQLRAFADQITRQKAAIYAARRGLKDKLQHAEQLHNELTHLGGEVYDQLDRLDDLMPSGEAVKNAIGEE